MHPANLHKNYLRNKVMARIGRDNRSGDKLETIVASVCSDVPWLANRVLIAVDDQIRPRTPSMSLTMRMFGSIRRGLHATCHWIQDRRTAAAVGPKHASES